jgi:hypothetical protein
VREYISMNLSTSNKGWHSQWFYLKNVAGLSLLEHVLPEFTGRVIEMVSEMWAKWGLTKKEKRRIRDHVAAINILREHDLKGLGVIGAYHVRRVAPLMAHVFPLHKMVPGVALGGRRCPGTRWPTQKLPSTSRMPWSP